MILHIHSSPLHIFSIFFFICLQCVSMCLYSAGYIDGYDEQYVDDEYMKDLPPTVEMGGYQNPHHMISRQYNRSRPFGNNPTRINRINHINHMNHHMNMNMNNINNHRSNTFINDNVMAHGIVTGNHLINDVIDEVVYDDNFKIEQTNNGYYDGTYTMYQSSEYPQDPLVNNNNLNINNHISNAYNLNNQQNYHTNPNSNNSMLCIDREITIPSIQQNPNIATIQVQRPFIPQFPNNGNFVTLPTLNGSFPINNNQISQQYDINDNQRNNINNLNIQRNAPILRPQRSSNSSHSHQSHNSHTMSINTMNQGNITPETTLTGQSSSSSDSSLSSGYAPSRGTNQSLNVSNKRYSPISTSPPKTPTRTPTTPRFRNRASNTSTNSSSSTPINYNDYTIVNNPRMIDSYQITPFSPSIDQHHDNNHNNNNYATAPPQFNQLDNNQMMMMDNPNDGVFTNLSNINSPTPLLGGFL